MKKIGIRIFFVMLLLVSVKISSAQTTVYDTRNGSVLPARGEMRILTICVNIVYDQTPERDPYFNTPTPQWEAGNPDVLNDHPPVWLKKFLDADYMGNASRGIMTRYFYESSLGHLIILGDFVVVNVLQSEITAAKSGADFNFNAVVAAAVEKINRLGGVKGVYGHDKLADYDMLEKGRAGVVNKAEGNGKIDFVMVFTRNTNRKEENGRVVFSYGQVNPGEGYSYGSNACGNCKLLIGNEYYENEMTTVQGVGVADYSESYKNIAFHEFAHNLFGSNAFHIGGGNHFGTGNAAVFMGLQGGFGLMGGYNASLVSCNAYERWRLGWIDSLQNPNDYEVAASGVNSAISRDDGPQSFILRDFVSTGDAVRIQLPQTDSGSAEQYLWLENHQVGRNGKIDFLQFSNEDNCREKGSPGIYAYFQVGRDERTSTTPNALFSGDETDNLRFLTSKGNWDMRLTSQYDTLKCIAWGLVKPVESYDLENPLTGYNDLQTHIWDLSGKSPVLDENSFCSFPYRIRNHGVNEPELPFMGDNRMAFRGGTRMDISSNPAPFTVVTHYTSQSNQKFRTYKGRVNNKHIYLSGLRILFVDLNNGSFRVDIDWSGYNLSRDVRWAGNIILTERLTVEKDVELWLDQSYTPTQLERDSVSGYFAPCSTLECEAGSQFELAADADLILDHNSRLIIKNGASIHLESNARIVIRNGASLIIEEGANVSNEGAKIKLKSGGKCSELLKTE